MADESDKSIEALERSLIAERHERLRLEANLNQAMLDKGNLDGQLVEVRAKVDILASEKEALYAEVDKYRALRHKLFLLMIVIIFMSTCMVVWLSTSIVYLMK
ncbi:hypothetical protein ACFL47_01300 [Candidatus Latescibacterota bacterium]